MKISIYVVFALLLLTIGVSSCTNNNTEVDGHWIQVFSQSRTTYFPGIRGRDEVKQDEDYYEVIVDYKSIISFVDDTLIFAGFDDGNYYGYNESTSFYSIEGDSIYIKNSEGETSLKYSLEENGELEITHRGNPEEVIINHFIQLEEHEMADQKERINSFLINNPITLGNSSVKIELLPYSKSRTGKFLQNSFETIYGSGNNWYFYIVKDELFLSIGNQLFHISDFDGNKLYAYTYNAIRKKVGIKKTSYKEGIDEETLLGVWEVSGVIKPKNGISDVKNIEFSEDKLIVNTDHYSDTVKWKLNKYGNKILIENDYSNRYSKYWKVENVLPHKLVIGTRRKIRLNSVEDYKTFYKRK